MKAQLKGLIAAVHTPMRPDGSIHPDIAGPIVEHLLRDGVEGIYVCGSTGEGPSLTVEERRATAEAFVAAAAGRIPVVVQVGHNSLAAARALAAHAAKIGADGVSAVPPSYFRCGTLDTLIACLAEIAAGAPDTPFYYYHVPRLSGTEMSMLDFLDRGGERLPTLAGVKYTALTVHEYQECLLKGGDRYTILFGCDEMLLSALAVGAPGAIGSTYNFAAPLYRRVIEAFEQRNLEEARAWQARSAEMVRVLYRYRGPPAFKTAMRLVGVDCGPVRLPLVALTDAERKALRRDLEEIGFFNWR